jgi:hypothetical protein
VVNLLQGYDGKQHGCVTIESGRTAGASRSPTQTKAAIPPAAAAALAAAAILLVTAAVQAKQLPA